MNYSEDINLAAIGTLHVSSSFLICQLSMCKFLRVKQTILCTHSYLKKLIHQQRHFFPILLVQTILRQKCRKSAFYRSLAIVAYGLRSYDGSPSPHPTVFPQKHRDIVQIHKNFVTNNGRQHSLHELEELSKHGVMLRQNRLQS